MSAIVLLAGLTACGSDRSTPTQAPPPAHHAKAALVRETHAAARIVTDPGARLDSLAVIPGHPQRRIAEWYVCRDRACHHRTSALVVSGDGFRTSHAVGVGATRVANGWFLEPAGPEHFAISPNGGRRSLVDLDGQVTRIRVGGESGPLTGAEVPLRSAKGTFLAVDTDAGDAHPLSTPTGVVEVQPTPSGQLRAVTLDDPHYFWSPDGGATWRGIPLPRRDERSWAELVPTPSASLHVLVLGGENTVFPWGRVLKSTDGRSWTTYDGPTDPTGYVDESAVLPDGRLVMNVGGWSDQWQDRPSVKATGLWAGADWAHLEPVPLARPFATEDAHGFAPTLLDVAVTATAVALYATTSDGTGAVRSADGGRTWQRVRAR